MISTKKHLSRRTFLRGAGVAVGLPFLDAMVPAWTALAQTAAAAKPRMGFMYLPHGAIMEHWTPEAVGTNFELPADPQAAGAVPEAAHDRERPGEQADHRAAGARAEPGHVAELRDAARDGRSLRRCDRGPDRGRAHRPGHAAAVDRDRHRRSRRQRRLRPDVRLLLRQHDLVPHADDAAADGGRSAQAVRAAVRPGRFGGRAQGHLRAGTRASWISCRRRPRTCGARSTGPTRRGWATTWRACARSSAACRRWKRRTSRVSTCPTCR